MKKILVPLDGSEQAYKALDFALDLAKNTQAKVWVFHVVNKNISEIMNLPNIPEELVKEIKATHITDTDLKYIEAISKTIIRRAKEKAEKKDVEIEIASNMGDPAEKIIAYTKNMDFDLIVIGETGIGKAKQFLCGSVTEKVAQDSPCPVTIVK
jgi:nucleotide-binding universal stress UspA family protein